jgi:hypothetical protein
MIYITVLVTLTEETHKWGSRKMCPAGNIVVVGDDGSAFNYKYTRPNIIALCQSYYDNPEVRVIIDPLTIGITKQFERYAYEELGYVMGCAASAKLKFKLTYKRTYYKYFGILVDSTNSAYNYCLANYPKLQMLYKFKDEKEADMCCAAYLATQFMESKRESSIRWNSDLRYIVEELDDGDEDSPE